MHIQYTHLVVCLFFVCALYLNVNVFSTKVLTGDTILTSPTGDGTVILRGHPSHAKVSPSAVQGEYLHFSVILRPWVMARLWESNSRHPNLQSHALTTELMLPRFFFFFKWITEKIIGVFCLNKQIHLDVHRTGNSFAPATFHFLKVAGSVLVLSVHVHIVKAYQKKHA